LNWKSNLVTEQSTLITQHSPPNAAAGHPKGQTLTIHAAFPSPIFGYYPSLLQNSRKPPVVLNSSYAEPAFGPRREYSSVSCAILQHERVRMLLKYFPYVMFYRLESKDSKGRRKPRGRMKESPGTGGLMLTGFSYLCWGWGCS